MVNGEYIVTANILPMVIIAFFNANFNLLNYVNPVLFHVLCFLEGSIYYMHYTFNKWCGEHGVATISSQDEALQCPFTDSIQSKAKVKEPLREWCE